jgi:hypothetical protein
MCFPRIVGCLTAAGIGSLASNVEELEGLEFSVL